MLSATRTTWCPSLEGCYLTVLLVYSHMHVYQPMTSVPVYIQ